MSREQVRKQECAYLLEDDAIKAVGISRISDQCSCGSTGVVLVTIPVIPVEHTNPPGAVLWQRWTPEGRHRTGAGRERDAALRSWRGYGILRESAFLVYTTSMYGRSAVNRPIISQTSSAVEVSRSLDAQASLLRGYTFGAFRLAWQGPPCPTEALSTTPTPPPTPATPFPST